MADPGDHLEAVGTLAGALERLGLDPILVGGMALVVLGSRRVTRDFDFLLPAPGDRLPDLVALVYDHGLALVSRLDADGEVTATIANRRVAVSRLSIDRPPTAYFYDQRSGLRVDLLFDFPLAAAALAKRAARVRVGAHTLRVADERDLLELKKLAKADRDTPGDAEDVAFLERRIKPRT
jgi:hypothetical protein